MLSSSSTPAGNRASSTPPSICHHSAPPPQASALPAHLFVAEDDLSDGADELVGAVLMEEHKFSTIGAVWASVGYSRKRAPQRTTSLQLIDAWMHAQALALAVLGEAAFIHYNNKSSSGSKKL